MEYAVRWDMLRMYIEEELDKPINNDDIPKSILGDILYKMDCLESED